MSNGFDQRFMEELRGRLSLADVVSRRVQWDRRKTNLARRDFWACCPFHSEKSPSFHVDDARGYFHCFGCGKKGDAVTFVMETERLSFPEAVAELAGLAGMELPERTEQDREADRKRHELRDVMDRAQSYFQAELQGPRGVEALAYVRRRGLRADTMERFGLGYAPRDRSRLKDLLLAEGFPLPLILETGLIIQPEDGGAPFDRFRDRVMFPVHDARGRIVTFAGRALSKDAQAKYLNGPETTLFHKGSMLFNLNRARDPALAASRLIVCEGYMDVIALAEAGFAEAVAPMGTALTADQLNLMWKVTAEPLLCFDGDAAGLNAAFRAVERALPLLKPGYSLRFALLPMGKDPDDLIRQNGADAFSEVLAHARPLSEILWLKEVEGRQFSTPEKRAGLEARFDDLLRQIGDQKVRDHYRTDLRNRMGDLFGLNRTTRPNQGMARPGGRYGRDNGMGRRPAAFQSPVGLDLKRSVHATRDSGAADHLGPVMVLLMLNNPVLLAHHCETFASLELQEPDLQALRDALVDAAHAELTLDIAAVRDHLANTGLLPTAETLIARGARNRDWDFARPAASAQDAESGWQEALSRYHRALLEEEFKAAQAALATEMTDENFARFQALQAQLQKGPGGARGR